MKENLKSSGDGAGNKVNTSRKKKEKSDIQRTILKRFQPCRYVFILLFRQSTSHFEEDFLQTCPVRHGDLFMVLSKSDPHSQSCPLALPPCSNILELVGDIKCVLDLRLGERTVSHCVSRHLSASGENQPSVLQTLGQFKLVLHRRHYSPPNSGDLTHQKWRGNNPLAQPALHLGVTEGVCLCGAGKVDAPSASAQGSSNTECFSAETESLLKDCISLLSHFVSSHQINFQQRL